MHTCIVRSRVVYIFVYICIDIYIYIYMHTHIYICIVRHKSSLTGGSCIKIRPGCLFTASLQCMELLLKGGTNNEYASASFFFAQAVRGPSQVH